MSKSKIWPTMWLLGLRRRSALGGIFTEALKDVTFRIAPLERRDAQEMIEEIEGYPQLTGARGQAAHDVSAVTDLLLSVSRMIVDHPEIRELDLNPARVYEQGLLVLDARVLAAGLRDE